MQHQESSLRNILCVDRNSTIFNAGFWINIEAESISFTYQKRRAQISKASLDTVQRRFILSSPREPTIERAHSQTGNQAFGSSVVAFINEENTEAFIYYFFHFKVEISRGADAFQALQMGQSTVGIRITRRSVGRSIWECIAIERDGHQWFLGSFRRNGDEHFQIIFPGFRGWTRLQRWSFHA